MAATPHLRRITPRPQGDHHADRDRHLSAEPEEKPTPCPGCDRAGDPLWCLPCRRLARACVVDVDRLVVWLEQEADGFASRSPGTYVAGGGSGDAGPSPTTDILDRVYADLVRFENAWRRFQGYSPTRRTSTGRTAHDRAITLAFISKNLTSIMLTPQMIDHVFVIMRWRIVLQHMAHSQPERLNRPGRCPRCHLVNVLYTDPEARIIKCRSCPMDMTEEEYENEVVADPDPAVVADSRRALGLPQ